VARKSSGDHPIASLTVFLRPGTPPIKPSTRRSTPAIGQEQLLPRYTAIQSHSLPQNMAPLPFYLIPKNSLKTGYRTNPLLLANSDGSVHYNQPRTNSHNTDKSGSRLDPMNTGGATTAGRPPGRNSSRVNDHAIRNVFYRKSPSWTKFRRRSPLNPDETPQGNWGTLPWQDLPPEPKNHVGLSDPRMHGDQNMNRLVASEPPKRETWNRLEHVGFPTHVPNGGDTKQAGCFSGQSWGTFGFATFWRVVSRAIAA